MPNKVKFGLSNCYYSKITMSGSTVVYGTPTAMKGAVNLELSPADSVSNFAADNIYNYYTSGGGSQLSGDLEMALFDDNFKKDILGYAVDNNGALYLPGNAATNAFALLFQFEGDANAVRHVLYNCTATSPGLKSNTTAETKEPVTDTVTITATPAQDTKYLHACLAESTATSYANWFTAVYVPVTA